jgi:hypothetical protein
MNSACEKMLTLVKKGLDSSRIKELPVSFTQKNIPV